ncbi:uncharacterized protein CXorf65-like [Argopecten irradians]|uniref:uncharacterized protein CXorf65-like n=1 Tax=Argopecten irradians TaxID=31199 RepID=UPI00371EDC51
MYEKTSNMPAVDEQTFIVVRYGDDESALFNPYCTSHTLTEWIRKKCHCEDDITIDLVDLEGQVKNLPTRPKDYASEMVTGRETYVLIRVERCNDGKFSYTSLLNNLAEVNPELSVKLSSMSRPTTRTSKNKKQKPQAKQVKVVRQESSQGKRPGSSEKPKKSAK